MNLFKVYLPKKYLNIFRFLMLCLATNIGLDIYPVLESGVTEDKYGNVSTFSDNTFNFLANVGKDISLCLFALYLAFKGSKLRE